jgi:hypothetical protein
MSDARSIFSFGRRAWSAAVVVAVVFAGTMSAHAQSQPKDRTLEMLQPEGELWIMNAMEQAIVIHITNAVWPAASIRRYQLTENANAVSDEIRCYNDNAVPPTAWIVFVSDREDGTLIEPAIAPPQPNWAGRTVQMPEFGQLTRIDQLPIDRLPGDPGDVKEILIQAASDLPTANEPPEGLGDDMIKITAIGVRGGIPTVTQWGLIILGTLVAAGGVTVVLLRRGRVGASPA